MQKRRITAVPFRGSSGVGLLLVTLGLASLSLELSGCQANLDSRSLSGDVAEGGPTERATAGVLSKTQVACDDLGDGVHPGPAPLRRLTHAEYSKTLSDILGVSGSPAADFPNEARALGFHGVAEGQTVSLLLVESYQSAAKTIAAQLALDVDGLLGCDPADAGCIADFITEVGTRAYRRPLEPAERSRLEAVYGWGLANMTAVDGIEMVLEVLLQSPDFLYRPENGASQDAEPGAVVRLTSYEMATRLSYLFLGSAPDAELLAAAQKDELQSKEQVHEQATRLIKTDAARETFKSFHSQWLDLEALSHLERDSAVYPGYSSDIPGLLKEETEEFINYVIFEDDASLKTLLTAPYTLVNPRLAEFYGLPTPEGDGFSKVETDSAQRIGLLTQGSLLAHHAQPLSTSPVHRGKFVRETILCQILRPPPDDLVIEPPDLDPTLTTRERFAAHSESTACAGCHALMDDIGLGFEHFDSVGRFREKENGLVIDATGELIEADVAGKFDGAVELSQMLGESDEVASCMVRSWVRFAHGRSETPEDACSLVDVGAAFSGAGYDIQELVLALTETDAFLYREVPAQ